MSSPPPSPADLYRQRAERFAGEQARLDARSRVLSWARLVAVAAGLVFLFQVVLSAESPPAWTFAGAALSFVVFAVLARLHARVIARQERWAALAALNRQGLARLARRWEELPPALDCPAEPPPPEVRDLGLFGPVSLARLLSTARTPLGRQLLAGWLLDPAAPAEVAERQAAVGELAPRVDWRQELELAGAAARLPAGRRADRPPEDPQAFLAWAEGEPWLLARPGLLWAARLLPVVALALIVAAVGGWVPPGLPALALIGNLAVVYAVKGRVDPLLDRVSARGEELLAYARSLAVAEDQGFAAPRLARLADALTPTVEETRVPASAWLARLRRRVDVADARHGSFHVIPQALVLWDLHALWLLERWQRQAGPRVRGWLEALAELEALAALAALAHDHPRWAMPRVVAAGSPPEAVYRAEDLGHPLLPDAERVGNDVELGPPGRFLLVTGSNMSGKSTLLRSIGANAVLAQAGAPVCAAALSLPPVRLATSVLVEDSLADGVSFFLAELLRLKEVVDRVERARAEGRVLLYLLDEILRGTNSQERREAVRRVIAHLVAAGAIGAVSTHDLELTEVPEVAATAVPVHFRETVNPPGEGAPVMTFDYLLRPGPATTTNALRLLEAVGLPGGEPQRDGDLERAAEPEGDPPPG